MLNYGEKSYLESTEWARQASYLAGSMYIAELCTRTHSYVQWFQLVSGNEIVPSEERERKKEVKLLPAYSRRRCFLRLPTLVALAQF